MRLGGRSSVSAMGSRGGALAFRQSDNAAAAGVTTRPPTADDGHCACVRPRDRRAPPACMQATDSKKIEILENGPDRTRRNWMR